MSEGWNATFDGIPIPKVFEVEVEDQVYGDFARTAGGKERGDVFAVKRVINLRTRQTVSTAERNQLVNHLRSILYRYGTFQMTGEEPFTARIELRQRQSYVDPDAWELTLTVIEQ